MGKEDMSGTWKARGGDQATFPTTLRHTTTSGKVAFQTHYLHVSHSILNLVRNNRNKIRNIICIDGRIPAITWHHL
jgi:hypothetical protein